jgi:hypothetical protein
VTLQGHRRVAGMFLRPLDVVFNASPKRNPADRYGSAHSDRIVLVAGESFGVDFVLVFLSKSCLYSLALDRPLECSGCDDRPGARRSISL